MTKKVEFLKIQEIEFLVIPKFKVYILGITNIAESHQLYQNTVSADNINFYPQITKTLQAENSDIVAYLPTSGTPINK